MSSDRFSPVRYHTICGDLAITMQQPFEYFEPKWPTTFHKQTWGDLSATRGGIISCAVRWGLERAMAKVEI